MADTSSTQRRIAAQVNAFKVAALQMASGPNVTGNLSEARRLIENAVAQGARLVVLPEFFSIMGMKDADMVAAREQLGSGVMQNFLAEMARKHSIFHIAPTSAPFSSTNTGSVNTASGA